MPTTKLSTGPNYDQRMTSGRELIKHDPNAPKMPCIVFNTMFKSGSVSTSATLQKSLGYSFQYISPGYVPVDLVVFDWVKEFFAAGSTLTQEHLDASPHNTQILKHFTDRMVVHVRDPRAVLLSAVHHFNAQYKKGEHDFLLYMAPSPLNEPGYFDWSLQRQIDWLIQHLFPKLVDWLNGWVQFKKAEDAKPNEFKVLFTSFEQFKANELQYFHNILDFYEIPRAKFNYSPVEKSARTHFRTGEIAEWKRVFTPAQLDSINKMIPGSLLERFNWEPACSLSPASAALLSLSTIRLATSYLAKKAENEVDSTDSVEDRSAQRLQSKRPKHG